MYLKWLQGDLWWVLPSLCTPKYVSRFTTRRPNFGSETSLLWSLIHWSTYTTFVSYVFVTSYHFIATQFVIYYLPHHLLSYPDLWIFWQKAVAGMPHRIHLVTFPESSIQHVDVLQRLCCSWFYPKGKGMQTTSEMHMFLHWVVLRNNWRLSILSSKSATLDFLKILCLIFWFIHLIMEYRRVEIWSFWTMLNSFFTSNISDKGGLMSSILFHLI